jgi:Transglutaminase-like superfamily
LEKNHRVPTPEIKAKADELTRGSKSELEKVGALYNFAAKQIRYLSLISLGIGGSEPHSAAETLHNAYGDCKDKTALLEALLEAEGIRASSVLISADRKFDLEIPSPWPFDHVITMLELGKDKIWLDPSSGYCKKEPCQSRFPTLASSSV